MTIILFTGLSASGKSTIANKVSQELNIPIVNLHQLLRGIIAQEGFIRVREWVDQVGMEQALAESRSLLITAVETVRNSRGVIVDEVLDPETLESLQKQFPDEPFVSIYIKANRHDRRHWILHRLDKENSPPSFATREIRSIDQMKMRAGIKQIIQEADLRVYNYGTIAQAVAQITKELSPYLTERNHGSKERL